MDLTIDTDRISKSHSLTKNHCSHNEAQRGILNDVIENKILYIEKIYYAPYGT